MLVKTAFFLVALALVSSGHALAFSNKDFIITFWCAPPTDQSNETTFVQIRNAGFNVVGPPCGPVSVEGNKKILDLCRKFGMKAIVSDPRTVAKKPDDPEFEKNLDSVIADYSTHPALYGYFLTDEPNSGQFPQLAAVTQYLLKKDPDHLPYINLFPTYANEQQLGNKTYEEHVSQYLRIVKNPLLSYDHYTQMTNFEGMDYFRNLEIIRREALSHNVPFMNIFLATPHGPYRNPTMDDLRWQVYTTLVYGAHGISYFTYWTPQDANWNFRNGIIDPDGKPTEHWDMVAQLNREVAGLSKKLVKLESKEVYHTAPVPPEAKPIPENWLVRKVTGATLVIGHFTDKPGFHYLMFVNRDMRNPAKAIIELAPEALPLGRVPIYPGGRTELVPIDARTSSVKIDLKPGEGKLYKIERWMGVPVRPEAGIGIPEIHKAPVHPDHQAAPGF